MIEYFHGDSFRCQEVDGILEVFVTDSVCDMPEEWLKVHPFYTIGMKIEVDGRTYTDTVDISREEFYGMVTNESELKTAFPSMSEVEKFYEDLKKKGVDEVISIHFSEKLSGFLDTYRLFIGRLKDLRVYLFDTRSASAGAGLIAMRLRELYEETRSIRVLKERFHEIRRNTFLVFTVNTLKYLHKNGRIGKAMNLIGTLLKIVPILTVDEEGYVDKKAVVRGRRSAINTMTEMVTKFLRGKKFVRIIVGYGAEIMRERVEELLDKIRNLVPTGVEKLEEYLLRISPTVACHTGPEVYGIGVYAE